MSDPDEDLDEEMCEVCGLRRSEPGKYLCDRCLESEYEEDDYWNDV